MILKELKAKTLEAWVALAKNATYPPLELPPEPPPLPINETFEKATVGKREAIEILFHIPVAVMNDLFPVPEADSIDITEIECIKMAQDKFKKGRFPFAANDDVYVRIIFKYLTAHDGGMHPPDDRQYVRI